MAFRRVPVVLGILLAMTLGASVPAGASHAQRANPFRSTAARAAIRRLASITPQSPAPDAGVQPNSLCWERDYTDPFGDGPIDALAYRLSYDCQTARWQFGVTLSAPLVHSTFDSLASEIDTDNNPNNGCDGFDLLLAGIFDDQGNQKGVIVATPSCDPAQWTTVTSAVFGVSGNSISLSYSEAALANAPRLIWNAGVVPKAATEPVDALPDTGVLVADKFLQQTSASDGYRLADSVGGVHAYGNSRFKGDLGGRHLARPIVGIVATPVNKGYWLVASDGGIFSFGDAKFYGSTGAIHLNKPIVGIASTPSGKGYWLVAGDGGIFSFGDANFYGSTGAIHLNKPIVGIARTLSGHGYWLVAGDGGIFSFGDANFYGSTGAMHLNRPIVGMAASAGALGYWLVAADGGIFSFGHAKFYGSTGAIHLVSGIVGMTISASGEGYRFVAADGGIFSFGDAEFVGGLGGGTPPSPIVGMD